MSRYIDADALINELTPLVKNASLRNRNVYAVAKRCLNTVEQAKTEDVAPVRHAKWIHPVNSDLKIWVCSNCGGEERNSFKREFGSYCSYCGAKMDWDEFIAPSIIAEGEDDHAD